MSRVWLLLAFASHVSAADWLSAHAHLQPAEKELSVTSVPNLKLLWKLNLGERLTSPVVLGPIYTHRGIKELVFVAGEADNLYSVDADLGRLFWKRHFETAPSPRCATGLTAAPVLAPYYGPAPVEAATPRRSLFVLTSDGRLRTVRPADAHDLAVALDMMPPGSVASDLTLTESTVSTYVAGGCANPQTGEWSLPVNREGFKASVQQATPESIQPVVANGLSFSLSATALIVRDATTGKQLYTSGANGTLPATSNLAIANGHVYLAAGGTLYCYGFPIEI